MEDVLKNQIGQMTHPVDASLSVSCTATWQCVQRA